MKQIIERYQAVDPPWYVLACVVFAVTALPGGIPLTAMAAPAYIRRRRFQLELAAAG